MLRTRLATSVHGLNDGLGTTKRWDVLEVVAQRTMKIITANATTTLTTSPMSISDENANSKASFGSESELTNGERTSDL